MDFNEFKTTDFKQAEKVLNIVEREKDKLLGKYDTYFNDIYGMDCDKENQKEVIAFLKSVREWHKMYLDRLKTISNECYDKANSYGKIKIGTKILDFFIDHIEKLENGKEKLLIVINKCDGTPDVGKSYGEWLKDGIVERMTVVKDIKI